MPIYPQLTLPSSSTSHFSAPPYNINDAMNAFYPPTLPCLTTTENTRDIHIRRLYPHDLRNSPTLG